jgi:hypothetical protein
MKRRETEMFMSRQDKLKQLEKTLGENDEWVRDNLATVANYPETIHTIEKLLSAEAEARGFDLSKLPIFNLNVKPRPEKPIFIGRTVWDDVQRGEVHLPLESFSVSSGIFGTTNAGKSSFIDYLTPQIVEHGIGMIFFDAEGQFKRLIKRINPEKVYIFNVSNDKENPYAPPPGVPLGEWKQSLETWYRHKNLKEGATNLISESLETTFNTAKESGREYPNVFDHLAVLQARQYRPGSRHAGYLESAEDRVKRVASMECYQCDSGYPLESLLDKVVVYDLSGLTDDRRIAYTLIKLLKLSSYYQRNRVGNGLRTICVLDECQVYVSAKISDKYDYAEHLLGQLPRTMRKYGLAFWYATHILTGLSPSLLGVLDNLFLFRTVHAGSLYLLSKSRNLSEEQLEYLATEPDRQMVLQSNLYPEATLIRVPDIELPDVTDAEVQEFMREKLAALPWTPDRSQANAQAISISKPENKPKWVSADDDLKKLLRNIAEEPFIGVNERCAKMQWNAWHIQERIKDALQVQFIKQPVSVALGGRGNSKKFLLLTEKGARFAGVELEQIQLSGKGSDLHKVLQNLITIRLREKGMNCLVEHTLGSKAVDVAILKEDGSYEAIEIELDPACPHVVDNITKDQEAGFQLVYVVTQNSQANKELQDKVFAKLGFEVLRKVRFRTLKEILE